ncbi:UDP-glucose 4-epimerase GalE [Solitalea koreensis]|uniref:UDP-glucose 4-epimerase n=1 Tax=Solitalea koreensis TaxID=543615 RepID=A0A521CS64_9SPHI|nr:UDP-glucose 4-epimerase GalE [Solitalea koreensis]SMO62304.1 UDP-galactose 4-epimerase [Solitalea koreensis]
MSKVKILVTGGTGYIGSHTVVELINAGFETVIIDDLSNSEQFILDRIEQITGVCPTFYNIDLCDKDAVEDVFSKEKNIVSVIHFAAYKAVGESISEPLKYYNNNLLSLINLLEVMKGKNVNNVVFSSSATVYGEPDILPITESAAIKKSLSAYGSTKQMGEDILEKLSAVSKINSIALRYFNPVGAHETALIGELPVGIPNNLMPFVTQTAIGKREVLTVFGDDYATPDGTCIRDYIHVVDLAKAHVKACERLIEGKNTSKYEVFNLGTGKGSSVLEIIETFKRVTGVNLNYKIGPRREGDAEQVYADTSLANNKLEWKAKLGLDEMINSAWKWEEQLKEKV